MSSFHFLNSVQPPQVTSLNLPPNVACVLYKKEMIKVEPTELPILQPDGVMVKVMATGICGSDMHGFLAGGVGGRPVLKPTVMGHESAGEVIAVGDLVTSHKVGDRVAIEPGLPCRRCVNCKNGRSNICIDMRYCGAPGSVGSLSKYYALPADMAPHIPDSVPWEIAGGIQPVAIGCQVAIRADIRPHQAIAICGLGPVGLIAGAVSHAYGARRIMGFDINPARVEFAKKYISPITGKPIFDHVFLNTEIPTKLPKASKPQANGHAHEHDELVHKIGEQGSGAGVGDADIVDPAEDHDMIEGDIRWENAKDRAAGWIEDCGLTAEEGFDRAIEATGSDDCGLLAVALTKQGGVCLAIGLGHINTKTMPMIAVTNKELDVRGITRYTAPCFPRAIDLLARKQVDIKQLITAKFPLTKSLDALNAVRAGKDIKVLIMNQEA